MNLTDEKILELAIGGGIYDCICDPYDKDGDGDQHSSVLYDLVRFARAILKEAGVEELELVAFVHKELADDGRSGPVIWVKSPSAMPNGTKFYTLAKHDPK